MRWPKLLAELIGTFGIVFAPTILAAGGQGNLLNAALVSGLSVTAMIVAFGAVSGAHFNPAVTLALTASGRFERRDVPGYLLAQCLGSLLAALLVRGLYGPGMWGTHVPTLAPLAAIVLEAVLTLILMLVILGKSELPGGLSVGLTVICLVLMGGAATGGSMNPARSLGPALVSGGAALANCWVYWIGPCMGALAAIYLSKWLADSK